MQVLENAAKNSFASCSEGEKWNTYWWPCAATARRGGEEGRAKLARSATSNIERLGFAQDRSPSKLKARVSTNATIGKTAEQGG